MTSGPSEFGRLLRAWRERVTPAELGLVPGGARRVPGLRREELAALANLSVDYIVRLEQGRSRRPSRRVVAALGRALRLGRQELDHFYRVAGHLPPSDLVVPSHISPGVQRLLSRLGDIPIAVYDAAWTFITGNALWQAIARVSPAGRRGNLVWAVFADPAAGEALPVEPEEYERFQRALVSDLRATSGKYPHDAFVRQLVTDLIGLNPVFAAMWADGVVRPVTVGPKTIHHPRVGPLTLDCDVLTAVDDDLRIVAYTAAPGSESAERLRLLRAEVAASSGGGATIPVR
ncbi:MAG: helix-turn-helix transcriptional regulator [Actinomycetes bacterium]|nr:MAG: transcriptional regulator [Actinomycetota bacterium]